MVGTPLPDACPSDQHSGDGVNELKVYGLTLLGSVALILGIAAGAEASQCDPEPGQMFNTCATLDTTHFIDAR